jgi:hypothetical protein
MDARQWHLNNGKLIILVGTFNLHRKVHHSVTPTTIENRLNASPQNKLYHFA